MIDVSHTVPSPTYPSTPCVHTLYIQVGMYSKDHELWSNRSDIFWSIDHDQSLVYNHALLLFSGCVESLGGDQFGWGDWNSGGG